MQKFQQVFFDTPEIRTFVCFLSIIDNPLQDIALAAVMKSCLFNFSDEALAMIRSISKNTSFYQACLSFTDKSSDGLLETYYTPVQYEPVRRQIEQMIGTLEHFRRCVFYMPIHKLILKIRLLSFCQRHADGAEAAGKLGYACGKSG